MSQFLEYLKSSIPSWLFLPKAAANTIKISALITFLLMVYPMIKLRIQETGHKYNHYTNSYDIVKYAKHLAGKVVIVTGCNAGIGKETAKQLYGKGCTVIMACRNLIKANEARQEILSEMQSENEQNLIIIRLDLADLKTIDQFVNDFKTNKIINGKLNFLINNAGVMVCLHC